MVGDLFITRIADSADVEVVPIPLADWLTYVHNDPEMRLDRQAQFPALDRVVPNSAVVLATWTRHPSGNVWLDFNQIDGVVVVHGLDEQIRMKMRQVAEALRAVLVDQQGDIC